MSIQHFSSKKKKKKKFRKDSISSVVVFMYYSSRNLFLLVRVLKLITINYFNIFFQSICVCITLNACIDKEIEYQNKAHTNNTVLYCSMNAHIQTKQAIICMRLLCVFFIWLSMKNFYNKT